MGVLGRIDIESESIVSLVFLLRTFSTYYMGSCVSGAREIIAKYTPKN